MAQQAHSRSHLPQGQPKQQAGDVDGNGGDHADSRRDRSIVTKD